MVLRDGADGPREEDVAAASAKVQAMLLVLAAAMHVTAFVTVYSDNVAIHKPRRQY